jgi:hypothetical protein
MFGSLVINAVYFPSAGIFMCTHDLAVFELHVPLRAGPRFFVPPISRKQKWAALIDDFAGDVPALKMSILRSENGRSRRRPKSSQSNA